MVDFPKFSHVYISVLSGKCTILYIYIYIYIAHGISDLSSPARYIPHKKKDHCAIYT